MKKIVSACFLFLFLAAASAFAKKTSVPSLSYFKLENGLELYVMENNAVPLVFIEIAVRAGSVTQTPENAGLFHLYEHMMFKGNAKFPDQKSAIQGLNRLGVSDWNGTTGIDMVNYYFQIPSSELRGGLEYWSYAIRTPLMDEKEFENEKGVVISEISSNTTSPSRIGSAALLSSLFPSAPWQLDSSGTVQTIRNATVSQLRSIQNTFYVPNNAALFVGGAVKAEEVFSLVKEIYGDWKRGEPVPSVPVPPKEIPVKKLVYPSPSSNGAYISAGYYLRGPDGEGDIDDVYPANIWANMVDNPSSEYARLFISDESLSIPDFDYIRAFIDVNRASTIAGFSAALLTSGSLSPVQKAERYFKTLTEKAIPSFLNEEFLNKAAIDSALSQIEKDSLYAMDSVSGYLLNFSNMWSSCGTDYQLTGAKKMKKVTAADIESYIKKYLLHKNGIFLLTVSPNLYEQNKAEFEKAGYELVTKDNAFWWQKNGNL